MSKDKKQLHVNGLAEELSSGHQIPTLAPVVRACPTITSGRATATQPTWRGRARPSSSQKSRPR